MLSELRIQDFAIIDDLTMELGPGFIIFTGETGAGKSIIIDAVEMILGGRAEIVNIRSGSEKALIEGTFQVGERVKDPIMAVLEEQGLLDENDLLILSREIRREGRNICRVNGRVVALGVLREIGQLLVDVHGQSEHLSLLRVSEHINLLDRFAQVNDLLREYVQDYGSLQRMKNELKKLRQAEVDSAQRADLLAFQINEIESADLQLGEEQKLTEERNRLANAEQLAEYIQQAILALDDGLDEGTSAIDLLGKASHALTGLIKVDASADKELQSATDLFEAANELVHRLKVYREQIEYSPDRLNEVEERIEMIRALQRKYGKEFPEIFEYAEKARIELDAITHAEERIEELQTLESDHVKRLSELAKELSNRRKEASILLAKEVDGELSDLRMEGAQFGVDQDWYEDEDGVTIEGHKVSFQISGIDRIEFLVAPNPGEGLKPLAKIASGGETTRLMLAMKGVLAQADQTPSLIFDEIDQGIGGRVGAIVGRKLWRLARNHQVLCITHLPQLAAYGDEHFNVAKRVESGRTRTVTQRLEYPERIEELALMLGGETDPNLRSAEQLLQQASQREHPA
jgi:DNA repair protein RecN (Recombination protein N)